MQVVSVVSIVALLAVSFVDAGTRRGRATPHASFPTTGTPHLAAGPPELLHLLFKPVHTIAGRKNHNKQTAIKMRFCVSVRFSA